MLGARPRTHEVGLQVRAVGAAPVPDVERLPTVGGDEGKGAGGDDRIAERDRSHGKPDPGERDECCPRGSHPGEPEENDQRHQGRTREEAGAERQTGGEHAHSTRLAGRRAQGEREPERAGEDDEGLGDEQLFVEEEGAIGGGKEPGEERGSRAEAPQRGKRDEGDGPEAKRVLDEVRRACGAGPEQPIDDTQEIRVERVEVEDAAPQPIAGGEIARQGVVELGVEDGGGAERAPRKPGVMQEPDDRAQENRNRDGMRGGEAPERPQPPRFSAPVPIELENADTVAGRPATPSPPADRARNPASSAAWARISGMVVDSQSAGRRSGPSV